MPNPLAPAELVTLPRVRAWLESLPADREVFGPGLCSNCVTANYLKAHGFRHPFVGIHEWYPEWGNVPAVPIPDDFAACIARWTHEAFIFGQPTKMTAAAALRILAQVEAHQ